MRSRVVSGMVVVLVLASCTSDRATGHGEVPAALAAELADHLEADFQELAGANGLAPSTPYTRIQGLSVDGGTVTSVLDVSRAFNGDESEVEVVGLDVKAMVVEPGTDEPYCVWLAATSTRLSSGIAVDGRDIDRGCEVQHGGGAFADFRRQGYRDAPTLMQQVPDDEGQTQLELPTRDVTNRAARSARGS